MLYVGNAFSPNMLNWLEGEVKVTFKRLSLKEAKAVVASAPEFISFVGHEGTAQLLSEQLGIPIPINRITIEAAKGDRLLIALPAARLPEGAVLSKEELQNIPVNYYLITIEG